MVICYWFFDALAQRRAFMRGDWLLLIECKDTTKNEKWKVKSEK